MATSAFKYERAHKHIERFVREVDEPTFHWAWNVVQGILRSYADATISPGESYQRTLASFYEDFLDAYLEGEANLGVIGAVEEFTSACPDENRAKLHTTLSEAMSIGQETKKGKAIQREVAKTAAIAAVAAPANAGLRLVVDNT
jgi:hypothetical protein